MADDLYRIQEETRERDQFIALLEVGGNVAAAARGAGRVLSFFRRQRRDDPIFAERWDDGVARGKLAATLDRLVDAYDTQSAAWKQEVLPLIIDTLPLRLRGVHLGVLKLLAREYEAMPQALQRIVLPAIIEGLQRGIHLPPYWLGPPPIEDFL